MKWGFGTAAALATKKTKKLAKTCNRVRMVRAYLPLVCTNKVS
jgi:hypothetical protein